MLRATPLVLALAISFAYLKACPVLAQAPPVRSSSGPAAVVMTQTQIRYEPIAFSDVFGWANDDHLAAFGAFVKSSRRLVAAAAKAPPKADAAAQRKRALLSVAGLALSAEATVTTPALARRFFEQHFKPHRVIYTGPPGLLTAYYEPLIDGSRMRTPTFTAPIYRRPPDLVNLVDESQRGAVGAQLTHARKTAAGLVPYATRAEIDQGALKGQGLELLYLADPVDVFFLQIQGSGRIRLPDGTFIRVTYDGKNGHPYTSIGRHLIDTGVIDAARMSLQSLAVWLKGDRRRGEAVMQHNASYVFFRELMGEQAAAPLGVLDVPLTAGRSMAVDVAHHALGLPIYVTAPALTHAGDKAGFHRLMIAQDVGSAIRGPERGDLFFGSGDDAARVAGITKHPGAFIVLLPNETASSTLKPSQTDQVGRTTGALPTAAPTQKPAKP